MKIILLYFVFLVTKIEGTIDSSQIIRQFNTYENITSYLISLSKKTIPHQKLVIGRIGETNSGHVIPVIVLGKYLNVEERNKPIILIDAGTHAREWITTAGALYVIRELAENKANEYLLRYVDWYIIPLMNPDGYKYSYTSSRMWRKNRSPGKKCYGVDLNRNWGFHWGEKPTSNDECSYNYRGRHPFSEPETRALRDTITRLRKRIKLYISLHSFGEYVLYPWGYTNKSISEDFENVHQTLGGKVAEAMNLVNEGNYVVGRQSAILYKASGISIDWVAGVAKIPLNFIIEMGKKRDRFTPKSQTIIPTGKELFEGLKVFHNYVEKNFISGYSGNRRKTRTKVMK